VVSFFRLILKSLFFVFFLHPITVETIEKKKYKVVFNLVFSSATGQKGQIDA